MNYKTIHLISRLTTVLSVLLLSALLLAQGFWQQSGTEVLRSGTGAPPARTQLSSVWTGEYLAVFGGAFPTNRVNDGGLYSPVTDSWLSKPNFNAGVGAPMGRSFSQIAHVSGKVFVYGGFTNGMSSFENGGMYDIATDTWMSIPNLNAGIGSPVPSMNGLCVVTEDGILIWGGDRRISVGSFSTTQGVYRGGVYNHLTDSWLVKPGLGTDVAHPQFCWASVWTGTSIIARGGYGGQLNAIAASDDRIFSAGGVFDYDSDQWLSRPVFRQDIPVNCRYTHPAAWTGTHYLEFGGATMPCAQVGQCGGTLYVGTGRAYNPVSDLWESRPGLESSQNAPTARSGNDLIWTGSHLLAWGGVTSTENMPQTVNNVPQDGDLYDCCLDVWIQDHALKTDSGGPVVRVGSACIYTGDRMVIWSGSSKPNGVSTWYNNGGVYVPPRVAPTIRLMDATPAAGKPLGDRGASAGNPLVAKFNQSFKHRIVCYGTPEAAIITYPDKPWWMTVGWGGPGPLVAHGTGQGNGGTGGAPPGTGAPFQPWFSANGGTADGQWIRGTPGPRDTGLHSFTVHAHNGIFPDTATKTVWIEVEGPSVIASMPTTYAGGAGQPLPGTPVNPGPNPPPQVTHEVVALAGVSYLYFPTIHAIPAGTQGMTATWTQTIAWNGVGTPAVPAVNQGFPAWLAWDGFSLSGIPGVSDEYQTINVTLAASNIHGSDSQQFVIHVLPYRPIHAAMLDANGDSVVDVLDVQTIVNLILSVPVLDMSVTPPVPLSATVPHPVNPSPSVALRGDLTLDGSVDTVDVQALVNGILGR